MQTQKAVRAIDRIDHKIVNEYYKKPPNQVWTQIHQLVEMAFGEIAEFEEGELRESEKLAACFVDDFYNAEMKMLPESLLPAEVLTTKESLDQKLVSANVSEVVILMGEIGVGKTTLIAHFMDTLHDRFSFVYVNLRNLESKEEMQEVLERECSERVNNLLVELVDRQGADVEDDVFEPEMRRIALDVNEEENVSVKRKIRRDAINSVKKDWILLTRRLAHYLRRHKPLCLVMDGADYIEDQELQEYVFKRVHRLVEDIHCNILLALRETSIPKNERKSAISQFENVRYHIMPPRSTTVLKKRVDYFKELVDQFYDTDSEKAIQLKDIVISGFRVTREDYKTFLDTFIAVLCRDISYLEQLGNYSVRVTLDLARCVVLSGHIEPPNLVSLCRGRKIFSHLVLKALVLYCWEYYNPKSAHIINLYCNEEPDKLLEGANLIRLRVLQVVAYLAKENGNQNQGNSYSPVSTAAVYTYMGSIGYGDRKRVFKVMSKFFDHGLIDLARNRVTTFSDDTLEINMTPCGYLYLDDLATKLRYVQCMQDASYVTEDCYQSIFAHGDMPSERVQQVMTFVEYIGQCICREQAELPEEERSRILALTAGEHFAKRLEQQLQDEIARMRLADLIDVPTTMCVGASPSSDERDER